MLVVMMYLEFRTVLLVVILFEVTIDDGPDLLAGRLGSSLLLICEC